MKKISCIIIDDEQHAIDIIDHYLEETEHIEVIGRFTNAIEANTWLKTNKTDLIFLDIQMPGINGIDFLRSLKNPPPVFLTTAYRHYGPEAFELNVLDYLLKPFSKMRFNKAIEKYWEYVNAARNITEEDTIVIRANRANIRIKTKEILYIESKGDYVSLHLKEKNILTKETLKNIIKRLPPYFTQVHRSYIVNTNHVVEENSTSLKINEEIIPVSRNFSL